MDQSLGHQPSVWFLVSLISSMLDSFNGTSAARVLQPKNKERVRSFKDSWRDS